MIAAFARRTVPCGAEAVMLAVVVVVATWLAEAAACFAALVPRVPRSAAIAASAASNRIATALR
jgi:hypothetical protein